MADHITENELLILAYLRDNARGIGPSFYLRPRAVTEGVPMTDRDFIKSASFLDGYGFVGLSVVEQETFGSGSANPAKIWLTSAGECYMRELDAAPGVARQVGVGVVKLLWDEGKGQLAAAAIALIAAHARL